ncbi:Predicted alpha/beta hydrolase [Nannocystis exedens]|uniref:Predicted alpha/beta hydrolase n=1 Tax=Nannocystis exedens TaxID=54 RepID=A0A1I1VUB6_9BACT|nr:alpha/beta hydrolase [Nannocystis exedens]PCC72842.1 enzyme [Nannocystis exedens]SFD86424.1 Predicted alpha/beta hydrolase [Nannocystis exedens]
MTAEHRIRAADGWRLSVLDLEPAGAAWGVVVAGHAMMVDRRTLLRRDRPCLARTLCDAGLRVLLPDLRGHGASGPDPAHGGDWSYDQLVEDTAVYLDLARRLAPDLPLATLGHSLFGHTTAAWCTTAAAREVAPAAHVALCADFWLPGTDDRRLVWRLKRLLMGLATCSTGVLGSLPARRFGVGSADEAYTYFEDFRRCIAGDGWRARDGHDYRAGLAGVELPVLLVTSEGDRLAPPRTAERLWSPLPRRTTWRLGPAGATDEDGRALPELAGLGAPGHMAAVTDPASAPLWRAIATWLKGQLVA